MQTAPPSALEATHVDLPDPANDPNTTNLDLTIHAHLNSSIVSTNKQALDKETVEKQKHEVRFIFSLSLKRPSHCSCRFQARLKYHFYVAQTILGQLKSSTNDDLIRTLITTLNLIDITTDDWTIVKNLRRKSKKVNKVVRRLVSLSNLLILLLVVSHGEQTKIQLEAVYQETVESYWTVAWFRWR